MDYKLYHYKIDDFDDVGFGCSYRNIQTILSAYSLKNNINIPNIKDILTFFYPNYEHIQKKHLWIEPLQISKYLLDTCNIKCNNLLYVMNDKDSQKMLKSDITYYIENNKIYNSKQFNNIKTIINNHFFNSNLPIVIDDGIYSYCVCSISNNSITLIDPHTTQNKDIIKIKSLEFLKNKFWMICIPDIN